MKFKHLLVLTVLSNMLLLCFSCGGGHGGNGGHGGHGKGPNSSGGNGGHGGHGKGPNSNGGHGGNGGHGFLYGNAGHGGNGGNSGKGGTPGRGGKGGKAFFFGKDGNDGKHGRTHKKRAVERFLRSLASDSLFAKRNLIPTFDIVNEIRDGKITRKEFNNILQRPDLEKILFWKLDANFDEAITCQEIEARKLLHIVEGC